MQKVNRLHRGTPLHSAFDLPTHGLLFMVYEFFAELIRGSDWSIMSQVDALCLEP